MKRFIGFLTIATLLLTNVTSVFPLVRQTSAEGESIWADSVILESDELVPEDDRSNAYCEWGDMSQRLYPSVPASENIEEVFAEADQGSYDLDTRETCLVQNKHGLFGGNLSGTNLWSPSGNPNNAIEMKNANIIAAPASNVVLTSSTSGSDPFGSKRISINYNLPGIGKLLAGFRGSGSSQRMLKQWALTSEAPRLQYANDSPMLFRRWAFSANGKYMVGALTTGMIVRIELQTQTMRPVAQLSTAARAWQLAVSNDGDYVLSYDQNSSALTFHDTTGCVTEYLTGEFPSNGVDLTGCMSTNIQTGVLSLYPEVPITSKVISNLQFGFNSANYSVDVSWTFDDINTRRKFTYAPENYVPQVEGYLAMGDSFTSGEGDTEGGTWYESGTDEQGDIDTFAGRNLCHLSRRSYPYLMAIELGYLANNTQSPPADGLFHSVACSGAKIHNIIGGTTEKQDDGGEIEFSATENQYRYFEGTILDEWLPGYSKQLGYIEGRMDNFIARDAVQPEFVTLGIGGNDIGFGKIIAACIVPEISIEQTCDFAKPGTKKSVDLIKQVAGTKTRLVSTYRQLREAAPEARIYVHGYPQVVEELGGDCRPNVQLDDEERLFASKLITYLNQVVAAAAREAGVFYVDIEDIFFGQMLCSEIEPEQIVVNGATAGNDRFKLWRKIVGSESYHPTPVGFTKYKDRILSQTNNLTNPMPNPVKTDIPVPDAYFGTLAIIEVAEMNDNFGYPDVVLKLDEGLLREFDYGARTMSLNIRTLAPSSTVEVFVESDPVSLGEYTLDESGDLQQDVILPMDLEPGYHEIHIIGQDDFGQKMNLYQGFILGQAIGDFDGDGVVDETDSCPGIANSGADADNDGVDDVCDHIVDSDDDSDEDTPYQQFCSKLEELHLRLKEARPRWLFRHPKRIVKKLIHYYCSDEVLGRQRFDRLTKFN